MNEKIVDMLTRLAINNPGVQGRFKMAAGIVYRKHLVATGVNSYKSHPMMYEWGKNEDSIFLHAEIDAIKNALKLIDQNQLSKCDMYIVRVKRKSIKDQTFVHGIAKPCTGCSRAIANFNLRNVYWTEDYQIESN
jgi:tRNA(Arg) A34 adenosine deaminase TadA